MEANVNIVSVTPLQINTMANLCTLFTDWNYDDGYVSWANVTSPLMVELAYGRFILRL